MKENILAAFETIYHQAVRIENENETSKINQPPKKSKKQKGEAS
jgi:hypothetical protein